MIDRQIIGKIQRYVQSVFEQPVGAHMDAEEKVVLAVIVLLAHADVWKIPC